MVNMQNTAIALLYAAALDRSQWPAAFKAIQQIVPAHGVGICWWDERLQHFSDMVVSDAYAADAVKLYLERFAALDPRQAVLRQAPPGSIIDFDRHPVADELHRSAFFRDFLGKIGVRYSIGIHCGQHADISTRLKLERSEADGPFKADEIRRLRFLLPHLRNIAHLRGIAGIGGIEQSVGRLLSDQLSDGAILVERSAQVRWLNEAAIEILTAGEGLILHRDTLRALRRFETTRLHAQIAGATGAQLRAGGAMLVGRGAGKRPYAVVISPLRTEAPLPGGPPRALVLIRDPDQYTTRLADRIGDFFGLSDAERSLAVTLLEGHTLAESARNLGKSMATLRTQLRSILRKTGTRSQSDLLRLLLSLPTLR